MTNMDKKMIKWIIPLLLIGGFISCTNGGKEEKETWSVKMARSEIQRFPGALDDRESKETPVGIYTRTGGKVYA